VCDLLAQFFGLFAKQIFCFTPLATCDNLPTIMPEQWKSITGLVELEQPASTQPPMTSTAKYAGQSAGNVAGFAQGLLFGIGVAVLGLILTFFFDLFTDFGLICYLAPAVGWLVGKAIKKGSYGAGGLRYQVAAIFLTYTATSLATAPYYFFIAEHKSAQQAQTWLADGWEMLYARCAMNGFISPFLSLQRGVVDIIGLVILFVGLFIAYRISAAK
jgi:hypothetical protein